MITVRTPFRVSLFGGGTDYPSWYKKNKALVIGGSINKYCFIHVRKLTKIFKYNYRLRYYSTEETVDIKKIKHGPYREALKYFNFKHTNVEIVHTADLPALSGLGASSSSTVCIVHALSTLKNLKLSKKKIAKIALNIEQKKLEESVGSQDQILAAYGGFNVIRFKKNLDFSVKSFLGKKKLNQLNKSSILVYTGQQRHSDLIEKKKIKNLNKNIAINKKIYDITKKSLKEFQKKKLNLKIIGRMLTHHWENKKKLDKEITNKKIDKIFKIALTNGAYGAKLIGSGNGGFVYVIVPQSKLSLIKKKLSKYVQVNISFESQGSTVIYNDENF